MLARSSLHAVACSLALVAPLAATEDPGDEALSSRSAAAADSFIRGDVDGDGQVALADAFVLLKYLFEGGPAPACEKAADVDDDGFITIADALLLLDAASGLESQLASPYPGAGKDPTRDELDCGAAAEIAASGQVDALYHVYDNGIVCVVGPCPSWTVVTQDGASRDVTDVDVSALQLEELTAILDELRAGAWIVRGHVSSQQTDTGVAVTLHVLELVGPSSLFPSPETDGDQLTGGAGGAQLTD